MRSHFSDMRKRKKGEKVDQDWRRENEEFALFEKQRHLSYDYVKTASRIQDSRIPKR